MTLDQDRPHHRSGAIIELTEPTARRLHRMALLLGWFAVVALAIAGSTGGLPRNPEGGMSASVQGAVQIGLLLVAAVALLLAVRWRAIGAVLLLLVGVGLSALAAVRHPPAIAMLVGGIFAVAAVALWVSWQRREDWPRVTGLAVVSLVALVISWLLAGAVFDHYLGPTHPESDVAVVDDPDIRWAWAGGVTAEGFEVVVGVDDGVDAVGVDISSGGRSVAAVAPVDVVNGIARLAVAGLAPDTAFEYRFVVAGGAPSTWRGELTTFPADSPDGELVIALSSCARTGSSGVVYDEIRRQDPDLYLITGDLHYENIAVDDVDAFGRAFDQVLTAPAQAALYRSAPIAYVWDDHDYSGNDGDASAASRPAARAAYEANVPSYPLSDAATINQAFSIGDVRVVVVDTRSARRPGETMLGEDQLRWAIDELITASATHRLVIWATPTPWIAEADATSDDWGGFAEERAMIADALEAHGVDNLMIVSGDAHMVAIDDGSNSGYGADGGEGPPVLQAAALDRPGSTKGGPYSEGAYPGGGQFGLIRIGPERDGVTAVTLEGRRWDGELLVSHSFAVER